MIIDANNLILGRLATVAAKKALLGEYVEIINCENVVITGNRQYIIAKFDREKPKGIKKGPFVPKTSDRFVKRAIKRMLPFKKPRGREALKKIKCYIGVPENLKDKKAETIENANVSKIPTLKYMRVRELCAILGGKWLEK